MVEGVITLKKVAEWMVGGKNKRLYERERWQILSCMQFSYCCNFQTIRLVVDELRCTNDLAKQLFRSMQG